MIQPCVHRSLSRGDLALLVEEIARADSQEGRAARHALEQGTVDRILDSPAALEAVRGMGGAPAALPLALLWYVPIRAFLRRHDEDDLQLADYAASLCLAFLHARSLRLAGHAEPLISGWWESIEALPPGTVARAERAADCGALALWWAGCFPERVARSGAGALRAYATFAAMACGIAARLFADRHPAYGDLLGRAADRTDVIRAALADTRADYLGRDAHTTEGRLKRFLKRLSQDN